MTDFYLHKKTPSEHWYQEPWMLLVLGGPVVVVIAALITFYIAWQGSDNVLARDYYKQGVNIDKDIERDAKAGEYKMLANIQVDSNGKIQLLLDGKTNLPATVLMIVTSHARASEYEAMQKVTLTRVKSGIYEGAITIPSPSDSLNLNLWHVKIVGPDWRLTSDWHTPLHSPLQLKPQN